MRYDDRGYQAGDELILCEIDNDGNYTGQCIRVNVTCVYRGEYCKRGYCIMSIEPCPMRVNYEGDGYDDDGNLIYDTAYCPNCGQKYEVDYDYHDDYCRNCGQALDWSFEDADKVGERNDPLDEAIRKWESMAELQEKYLSNEDSGINSVIKGYAAEHRQLAEWLTELKERRTASETTKGGDDK